LAFPDHTVFVAEDSGRVLGTCYLRPNQRGGGSHVANCAFMTRADAGGRGVASALWQRFGFEVVGRLPGAFRHPALGLVDALVMFRQL
jgi:hypothetical protein